MKTSVIVFVLLLLCGAGAFFSYLYLPAYSLRIPQVRISIQLPDADEARPSAYFTEEERKDLQRILAPYRDNISNVKIMLDHFHTPSPVDGMSSFQLIITTAEGCILQTRPQVTRRMYLTSDIDAKVRRSFELFDSLSRTSTYQKRNLARISDI